MLNSLFVYGTLMIPEITFKLLDKHVKFQPAILNNYKRVALENRGSKAKGPSIFPSVGNKVIGFLLSDLSFREIEIIHRFEDSAKGYDVCNVEVELNNGKTIKTITYVLKEDFKKNINGEWLKEDFTKNHLDYYLNERIPNLLNKWGFTVQNRKDTEEKQMLYLKRNWELLEVFKSYRMRIPGLTSSAMVVFTSFFLQSKDIPKETPELIGVSSLILLMGIFGCVLIYWVWQQYKYTNNKIEYLYGQINIKGNNFFDPDETQQSQRIKHESAPRMFIASFLMIIIICLICTLGVTRFFF